MMKTRSLFAALLIAVGVASIGTPGAIALDFTLRYAQVSADGASVDSPYISDNDSKIFLRIPRSWKTVDNPGALELVPEIADCRVKIENVSGVQALPLDAAGKLALRQRVDKAVPDGAKNVVALEDADNPLPIFSWKDVEMTREYEFYGQSICRSMMFLNMRPGRVILVTVTAPKAEFDKIHDAVRVLMFSWFEPSKDLPPEVQRKIQEGKLGGT